METIVLAPLRSFDNFCLQGARFQVPDVSETNRWNNRILNNLLYYQTNYFLTSIIVFLLVGVLHPVEMLSGIFIVLFSFVAYARLTDNRTELRRFKQKHSLWSLVAICFVVYLIGRMLGSLLVFTFGLLLPLLLTLLHASLRMRNTSNKISRFKEYVGLKRTPMGVILEALGQEQEAGS